MLSRMLNEAIEAVTEDMEQEELEAFLEFMLDENEILVEFIENGWDLQEALDYLTELKVPSPKEVAAKKKGVKVPKPNKASKANLRRGNPNNNPWSDWGKNAPKKPGTNTRHSVFGGSNALNRTGEWSCGCEDYTCNCTSLKRKGRDGKPMTKTFTIKKSRHLAYNQRYKQHAHPNQEHPHSV